MLPPLLSSTLSAEIAVVDFHRMRCQQNVWPLTYNAEFLLNSLPLTVTAPLVALVTLSLPRQDAHSYMVRSSAADASHSYWNLSLTLVSDLMFSNSAVRLISNEDALAHPCINSSSAACVVVIGHCQVVYFQLVLGASCNWRGRAAGFAGYPSRDVLDTLSVWSAAVR